MIFNAFLFSLKGYSGTLKGNISDPRLNPNAPKIIPKEDDDVGGNYHQFMFIWSVVI